MPCIGRFTEPKQSLLNVLGNAQTMQTHARETILRLDETLFCRLEIEIRGLLMELRHTKTMLIHFG